jgi:hypothetical protein
MAAKLTFLNNHLSHLDSDGRVGSTTRLVLVGTSVMRHVFSGMYIHGSHGQELESIYSKTSKNIAIIDFSQQPPAALQF